MEFTGERVIPGQVDADLWNEHYGRYAFAAWIAARHPRASQELRVLDAGCGSGYGAALLGAAGSRISVTGCDISADAVAYASAHYASDRVRFVQGDGTRLSPEQFGEFDLVVSFEVIEHVPDPAPFLAGVRSVLAAGGWAVASTPNRRYYTDERDFHNPFHTREYDTAEFDALLAGAFACRATFTQNHAAAVTFVGRPAGHACPPAPSSAAGDETTCPAEGHALIAATPSAADEPYFIVAVCSNTPLPELPAFVFVPSAANVLREREQHIHKLEEDLGRLKTDTDRELAERRQWAEQLQAELAARDATVRGLQAELARRLSEAQRVLAERDKDIEERTVWARSLEADVQRANEALANLQKEFDARTEWALKLQAELGERTAWAQRLDAELSALRADMALLLGSFWYRAGKKLHASPVPHCDRG